MVLRFATQNDYFLVSSKREEFVKFGEDGAPIVTKTAENDTNVENVAE